MPTVLPELLSVPNRILVESMEATLSHSYARHPKLQDYWYEIYQFFSVILEVPIKPDPILIILGISEELRTELM